MHRLLAVLVAFTASPLAAQTPDLLPAERPIPAAIDDCIQQVLRQEKITPAPQADDATILRRLTLDLAGRIPTVAELAEYTASADPRKKERLVDRLLAAPSFVRHQATELNTLLQAEDAGRKGVKKTALREYLVQSLTKNRGWDKVFRDLMLPDESDAKKMSGANEFLKTRVRDLNKLTIDVSTIFFGVNVSCAQCHDHPLVHDWKQDHFYGLKSFFVRTVDNGGFIAERDFGVVKYLPHKGVEKEAPVMFLTGKTIDAPGRKEPTKEEKKKEQERLDTAKKDKKVAAPPQYSLRSKLVDTALEPGQRDFFAKAIVNRTWHRFVGRGFVMPLDQMHSANPPSHPELLDWLARDLIASGYDLRRLIRGIVLSEAYGRSSRWDGDRPPQDKFFAVAQVRPLTPLQMAVSLKVASLNPTMLPTDAKQLEERIETLEKGADSLAKNFPQPGDNFQVGVAEAMLFANNEAMLKELLDGAGTLTKRLVGEREPRDRVELATRAVLSRSARPEEVQAIAAYLQERSERLDAACQQVIWALMTSAEFRFNH